MAFELISINWTKQKLSPEQLLVLRNVAALHLRRGLTKSSINFTHELIEGILTLKSHGLFVTFVGTFFHADLGKVGGEDWTVDFLLPKGSENIVLKEDSVVITSRRIGDRMSKITQVNPSLSITSEASLLE